MSMSEEDKNKVLDILVEKALEGKKIQLANTVHQNAWKARNLRIAELDAQLATIGA